jgi:hypothetical protein
MDMEPTLPGSTELRLVKEAVSQKKIRMLILEKRRGVEAK